MKTTTMLIPFFALLLLAAPTGVAAGDAAAAKACADRGAAHLEKGELDPARAEFEAALAKREDYPPALLGLARIDVATERPERAIPRLGRCLDQAGAADLDPGAAAAIEEAQVLLAKLDAPRAELRKLLRDHQVSLLHVADRYGEKDPACAAWAMERILAVTPGCREASRRLREIGPLRALAPGEPEVFFDGGPTKHFQMHDIWQIGNGVLSGDPGSSGFLIGANANLKGDYMLEADLRVTDRSRRNGFVGIFFASTALALHHEFAIAGDGFTLFRSRNGMSQLATRRYDETEVRDFDPTGWHRYRVLVTGRRIRASADGRIVLDFEVEADVSLDGALGLNAQYWPVECRRFVVYRR